MQDALEELHNHLHRHNRQSKDEKFRINPACSLHNNAGSKCRIRGSTAGGIARRLDLLLRSVIEASQRPLELTGSLTRNVNRAATEGGCSTAFLDGDPV